MTASGSAGTGQAMGWKRFEQEMDTDLRDRIFDSLLRLTI